MPPQSTSHDDHRLQHAQPRQCIENRAYEDFTSPIVYATVLGRLADTDCIGKTSTVSTLPSISELTLTKAILLDSQYIYDLL